MFQQTSPSSWAHRSLLKGEDSNQYQALFTELVRTVKPTDITEWLQVRDIVDLTWNILRYRRMKARWIESIAFGSLHLIEQMQASAELRCNNALNEIESRRASLGQALRQTSDHVIEAQATPALVPAG
jgi:hypothetical protein